MYTCVHVRRHVGRLSSSWRHLTFIPASFMRTEGPREIVSLCFTGLVIFLSGLGGRATALLAVYIKTFIRRLSGLALPPSGRTMFTYSPPVEHFSCPLDQRGSSRRPPTWPSGHACGTVVLVGPSPCSPLTVMVRLTDEAPEPRRWSVWFEATRGVWGWCLSPGVFSPKAHSSSAFLSLRPLPLCLTFWSARYGNNRGTRANWLCTVLTACRALF